MSRVGEDEYNITEPSFGFHDPLVRAGGHRNETKLQCVAVANCAQCLPARTAGNAFN